MIATTREYPQKPELAMSSSYGHFITYLPTKLDKTLTKLCYTQSMIDVHCHLNFHAFEKDYDECIQEAKKAGVHYIINVGTKLDSSNHAIQLANAYDNLYAIVGVHPHHADKNELRSMNYELKLKNQITKAQGWQEGRDSRQGGLNASEGALAGGNSLTGPQMDIQDPETWLQELEHLARQPKVVAIGEIGMDYFRYQSNGIVDPVLQKEIFEAQIELAHRVGLPIQIHNRHAGKDVLEILRTHKNLLKRDNPGMFHCFAGDMDVLKGALDLGFYIGFDGNSTYPGLAPGETTALPDLARATPLDRMVTETDSPFLTPIPFRGSRNSPAHVILVGKFLAQLKGISFEELDYQTEQNAKRLFDIQ